MSLFRLPGRFEWKILIALFIVALVPLGAAAFLMSVTIGRVQVLTEQHQEAVRRSLGGAVEVYRSYFAEMKETFRERANEIRQAPVQAPPSSPTSPTCCTRASSPARAWSTSGTRRPRCWSTPTRRRRRWWRWPRPRPPRLAAAGAAEARRRRPRRAR